MREFVYLSDAKLSQFLSDRRALPQWSKVSVKLPAGGFDVDRAQDDRAEKVRRLDAVVRDIASSAAWFTEPDVRPGHWVQFEAPLNYLTLNGGDLDGMLLFVDLAEESEEYPTGGSVRLLLHGSARHLMGGSPLSIAASVDGQATRLVLSGSGGPAFVCLVNNTDLLQQMFGMKAVVKSGGFEFRLEGWDRGELPSATRHLLRVLDEQVRPETATWMAGYARITANLSYLDVKDGMLESGSTPDIRYVVASPLYVEYSLPH
jgi:hypothetical protein